MHDVTVEVLGLENTVTRPVIRSIVEEIKKVTGIPLETGISLPSFIGEKKQSNSAISNTNPNEIGLSKSVLYVSAVEEYGENDLGTTAVGYSEYNSFFKDYDTRLLMKPVYVQTELDIEITYLHRSKTKISEWMNRMRLNISKGMDINYHDLSYKYIVPGPLIDLLVSVHDLREKVAPYGQSIETYIKEYSDGRLTWLTDIANKDIELAVSETQKRIQGTFIIKSSPESIEIDKEKGYYSLKMNYKVNFQKPIAIHVKYPSTVNNQLLAKRFLETIDLNAGKDEDLGRSMSMDALKGLEQEYIQSFDRLSNMIVVPSFDRWMRPDSVKFMIPIMSVLVTITPEDKRTLFNLNNIGNVVLDSDILNWLSNGEYVYITDIFKSMFNISLHKNTNELVYSESLSIDSDLNISSTIDLDLTGEYRVIISLIGDTSSLPESALRRLVENPKALGVILETLKIFPKLKDYDYLEELMNEGTEGVLMALKGMKNKTDDYYSGMMTVMYSSILAINK